MFLRFDKMEVNIFEISLIGVTFYFFKKETRRRYNAFTKYLIGFEQFGKLYMKKPDYRHPTDPEICANWDCLCLQIFFFIVYYRQMVFKPILFWLSIIHVMYLIICSAV